MEELDALKNEIMKKLDALKNEIMKKLDALKNEIMEKLNASNLKEIMEPIINDVFKENRKKDLLKEYKNLDTEVLNRKKTILTELKDNNFLTVADNIKPDCNICFILSCPGERELIAGYPCAGKTGENLLSIMDNLQNVCTSKTDNKLDISFDKNKIGILFYNIINSSNNVYFKNYDEKSEETDENIKTDENLKRVCSSLGRMTELKYLVLCGDKATVLYSALINNENFTKNFTKNTIHVAEVCHLGDTGLRNTYKNKYTIDGKIPGEKGAKTIGEINEENRDSIRFQLVAQEIYDQFTKMPQQLNG